QCDIIPTVPKFLLVVPRDIERYGVSIIICNFLLLQVYMDVVCAILRFPHPILDLFLISLDEYDAVLECIIIEDICIAWCNDYSESIIQECPRSGRPGRRAAEDFTREANRGPFKLLIVQSKTVAPVSLIVRTQVVEDKLSEPGPFDTFRKLFWNDLIRKHVASFKREQL